MGACLLLKCHTLQPVGFAFVNPRCRKELRPRSNEFQKNPQAEACATENPFSIVILRKEWRAEKVAGRARTKCVLLLDSAPPDSSDDSGPVLAKPPSRLGGTAVGDFGGKFCCTFHSGLRSSSEPRPGYSLLPHLYQDAPKIASPYANGQTQVGEWSAKSELVPFVSNSVCSNRAQRLEM